MLAARTQLSYLIDHQDEIYPRLADELTSLRNALVGERAPDATARGWSGWRLR